MVEAIGIQWMRRCNFYNLSNLDAFNTFFLNIWKYDSVGILDIVGSADNIDIVELMGIIDIVEIIDIANIVDIVDI